MREWLSQAVKFGMVGVINTLVDYGVFWLLNHWLPYHGAKVISYCCGMISSFILNRRFTFGDREAVTAVKGAKFVLVNLLSLLVSLGVITLCVEVFHIQESIANIISTPFSMAVNFVCNKLFVFASSKKEED